MSRSLMGGVGTQTAAVPVAPGCNPREGNYIARFVLLVDDHEREIEFFTQVLDFELISINEYSGPDLEALYAVPNLKIRVGLLKLGNQNVSLVKYVDTPGACYPEETRGHDIWFQHLAIVVSDMKAAYARLMAAGVKATSPHPVTIPETNHAAAGVQAFYFRDPENHPLELISFPPDKGLPVWQEKSDKVFLGIDHCAITVAETAQSLRFYRDLLGLEKTGESLNYGESQEVLSGVKDARVHITGLRYNHPTAAGIEFLHYLEPEDGKPIPAGRSTTDRAYAHTVIFSENLPALVEKLKNAGVQLVSPGVVKLRASSSSFAAGCVVRDPDGHDVLLVGNEQPTHEIKMKPEYRRLNHVTINVPAGEHDKVRAFYGGVLGLKEIPFPQALASTYDLIWFECLDFLIHVDFTPPYFRPAENRHPALEVKNIAEVRRHFESLGAETRDAVLIPDRDRFYVLDPFGNYFEIIEMHADQGKA